MYKRINELLGLNYKSDEDISWLIISISYNLSEEFIKEFSDYLLWGIISEYQALSEDFIRKYKDKINWTAVSECQILSWDFILEFKDKLDLNRISLYQPYINPFSSLLNKDLLKINGLLKLYQQTKDRGWFFGYIHINLGDVMHKFFTLEPTMSTTNKVRIYWKDLIMLSRVRNYELIRKVKYV